jgi:predicted Rossmann fold flavoprotein
MKDVKGYEEVSEDKRVIIVGGGAAGMAAAIVAARQGARVLIIEQNDRLGKKILATGNGRCNLSNTGISAEQGFSRYHHQEFVAPTLGRWDYDAVCAWFSRLGLLTVADERGWAYPRSKWANSVLDVLVAEVRRLDIELALNTTARSLEYVLDDGLLGECDRGTYHVTDQDNRLFTASHVILANGVSGITCALRELPVQKSVPILGPLGTETELVKGLDGVRCECAIQLVRQGEVIDVEAGELLFRSYGVSGIAVFNLSRYAMPDDELVLDLFPERTLRELEDLLEDRAAVMQSHRTPAAQELFVGMLHSRLALAVTKAAGIKPQAPLKSAGISRLATQLKSLKLKVTERPKAAQAQVTRGGLAVEAFNPATLEAHRYPGLFAAGEALDVDGPCGGYNLHWAWASGIVAGEQAAGGIRDTFDPGGDEQK